MKTLKILNISTSDHSGGASRAAYNLHKSMQSEGLQSKMVVANKSTPDDSVTSVIRSKFQKIARLLYPSINFQCTKLYKKRKKQLFSPTLLTYGKVIPEIEKYNPDIVVLYWIAGEFINPKTLANVNKPIVWRLSDFWPFTGGCHYPGNCEKYVNFCGNCDLLASKQQFDLSRIEAKKKAKAYKQASITVVAPSKWILEKAKRSALFLDKKIVYIPTGVNTETFAPIEKKLARKILGLDENKKIILFGAANAINDPRKGYPQLIEALKIHCEKHSSDEIELVVFGNQDQNTATLPIPIKTLGRINDNLHLSLVYSAADITAVPSLEDNLPNTALESMACGTPAIGYNQGGLADIITHQNDGYLVNTISAQGLQEGIEWLLNTNFVNHDKMCAKARKKIEENYTHLHQANAYKNLFQEILRHEP